MKLTKFMKVAITLIDDGNNNTISDYLKLISFLLIINQIILSNLKNTVDIVDKAANKTY